MSKADALLRLRGAADNGSARAYGGVGSVYWERGCRACAQQLLFALKLSLEGYAGGLAWAHVLQHVHVRMQALPLCSLAEKVYTWGGQREIRCPGQVVESVGT